MYPNGETIHYGDLVEVTSGPATGKEFAVHYVSVTDVWDLEGMRYNFSQLQKVTHVNKVVPRNLDASIKWLLEWALSDFDYANPPEFDSQPTNDELQKVREWLQE